MSYNDNYDGQGRHQGRGEGYEGGRDDSNEVRRDDRYGDDERHGGGRREEYGSGRDEGYEGGRHESYGGRSDGPSEGYGGGRDNDRREGYGGGRDEGYGARDEGFTGGRNEGHGGMQHNTGTSYGVQEPGSQDLSGAAHTASEYAGDAGDHSFFSSMLSNLTGQAHQSAQQPVGEADQKNMVQQHQNFFGGGSGGSATSGNLGAAAAIQALKLFTGGANASQASQGSGGAQNAFVGMAMGEAAKLFEQQNSQGNTQSGVTKDSVVQEAGKLALKMYLQSQTGNTAGGGLMSMASKFL